MSASVPTFESNPSRTDAPAVIGGTILGGLGFILLIIGVAFVAAWYADARGFVTRQADHELIVRMVTLAPLVVLLAIIHLVAAGGLVLAAGWARGFGSIVAVLGMVAAILGLIAVGSGHDPFASVSTVGPAAARSDGMGILAVVLGAYTLAATLVSWPARQD